MSTRGRIEARITIPTGGYTGTVDDSGGAGAAVFTIAAGTYYLSSAGGAGSSLLTALAAALNAAAPTDTFAATISAGESGTGKVTIASTGTATIAWTSTALRDVLGFTADLPAGTSWTGGNQAKALWLPDCPYNAPNELDGYWWGEPVADYRTAGNAAGYLFTHVGPDYKTVLDGLAWEAVSRDRAIEANETTENASWESFVKDGIWGMESWGTAGGPIRIYPDADDDVVFCTYKPEDLREVKLSHFSPGFAAGSRLIAMPRLILDPASEGEGAPREDIVVTSLLASGSSAGGTSHATASISVAEDSLILVAVYSHGTGAGNAVPTGISGAGLTFTQVDAGECEEFNGVGGLKTLTLWRAYATAAGSGALTITHSPTTTRIAWSVVQATGVSSAGSNGAGAIAQYKTNVSAIDVAASATFDDAIEHPNNVCLAAAAFSSSSPGTYTAASGFTKFAIAEPASSPAISGSIAYKQAAATATADSGSALYHAIIAVELVAA